MLVHVYAHAHTRTLTYVRAHICTHRLNQGQSQSNLVISAMPLVMMPRFVPYLRTKRMREEEEEEQEKQGEEEEEQCNCGDCPRHWNSFPTSSFQVHEKAEAAMAL